MKKKINTVKYPEKTSINLLLAQDGELNNKKQIALFILFLVFLGLFTKFGVIDRMQAAFDAKEKYTIAEEQLSQLQQSNEDYDVIREQYSHYGNGYLNDEEKAEIDRIEILALLDTQVMNKADVQSIDIVGNEITVIIDKIKLKTISRIVTTLESNDKVTFVTVSTAGTGNQEKRNGLVTATMTINMDKGDSAK